MKIAKINM